ncbi:Lipopolysaccharide export system permease protein LptG [Candidatus Brocadiaceae bacterium B188]|nr:LptF/LptG family permease [Candidatus Brocadia sapporoensis]MEB2308666.1 LptF/LptG family permease [Candidatus Brocadiaceae bacterium]RZV58639.1 MAG: YjgP/YjgQ family permease [Candidatus Brocadia sp. BROELEC01]TWU53280.1 Lipopolysaccharide export system permease protein LptG [Candidatus Brocadiaceae bacterium B188]
MFSRLDNYILKAFIPTFFMCLLIISGIYIVADLLQKLGEFVDMGSDALSTGMRYYMYLFPVIVFQFFPAITLIAVGIVLVKLSRNREILAMQVAGISLYRILVPIFIVTAFLSFASFGDQEWIIPRFAERLETLRQTSFDDNISRNLLLDDKENGTLVRIWRYNKKTQTMQSVFILGRYENKRKKFTINADEGRWIGNNTWLLSKVTKHIYNEQGKWVAPIAQMDTLEFKSSITPTVLGEIKLDPSLLSFEQLKELCKNEPNNPRNRVLFHSRIAYTLTHFVLLLLGIPLVIGFDRLSRNLFLRVGLCVFVCGVFYALSFVCTSLCNMGAIHPILAAWLPHIMFGSVGLLFFDMMRM